MDSCGPRESEIKFAGVEVWCCWYDGIFDMQDGSQNIMTVEKRRMRFKLNLLVELYRFSSAPLISGSPAFAVKGYLPRKFPESLIWESFKSTKEKLYKTKSKP